MDNIMPQCHHGPDDGPGVIIDTDICSGLSDGPTPRRTVYRQKGETLIYLTLRCMKLVTEPFSSTETLL